MPSWSAGEPPEAVFAARADYIPTLLENGRKIDELDDKGPMNTSASCSLRAHETVSELDCGLTRL